MVIRSLRLKWRKWISHDNYKQSPFYKKVSIDLNLALKFGLLILAPGWVLKNQWCQPRSMFENHLQWDWTLVDARKVLQVAQAHTPIQQS